MKIERVSEQDIELQLCNHKHVDVFKQSLLGCACYGNNVFVRHYYASIIVNQCHDDDKKYLINLKKIQHRGELQHFTCLHAINRRVYQCLFITCSQPQ